MKKEAKNESKQFSLAILIVPVRHRLLLLSLLVTPVPKRNAVSVCMCCERVILIVPAHHRLLLSPLKSWLPLFQKKNDVSVCAGGLSTEAY